MPRFRTACVAAAISMAAIFASSNLSDAAIKPTLTIVAFGSSSTQGVGASTPGAAYPAQLQAVLRTTMPKTPVVVVNRGIGGEDIDDMMVRLDKDIIGSRPNIVIWQAGSNDPLRHVPMERFDREMRAGIAAMRKAGIDVVLMEPQWCPTLDRADAANTFRNAVRAIGADLGVEVIRRSELMHDWVRTGRLTMATMLSPDGLHMRDDGYRMLAGEVAAQVLHMDATMVASRGMIRTAGL